MLTTLMVGKARDTMANLPYAVEETARSAPFSVCADRLFLTGFD